MKETVEAEWEPLTAVRVHEPGFETLAGVVDPLPNLFRRGFSLEAARREHGRLVAALEDAGVTVRTLTDELAAAGQLSGLVAETVAVDTDGLRDDRRETVERQLHETLRGLSSRQQLQLIAAGARVTRLGAAPHDDETDSLAGDLDPGRLETSRLVFDEPASNLYFQRDQQITTPRGHVLCAAATDTRRREREIVARAVDPVHRVSTGPLEGGDYLPAGEFGLFGVSADRPDGDRVVRTSRAAARELLAADAVGHSEVGLVRAPLAADRRSRARHAGDDREAEMEIMHLDTWFNVAGHDLAVGREPLVEAATVEVFVRDGDGYHHDRDCSLADYLDHHGFDLVAVPHAERAVGTNFLTLSDRTVLPIYYPDEDGAFDPERNETIRRLRDAGVEIVPDGTGLPMEALRSGYGGVHCMTAPLARG
ncbi:arginine deiminase family protein [Halobaculum sp. MBLA0143]|uniref:arginine deiminase family protein n=1 Tax=Halobaculum sp. MBLA0143 TaxID=3079933 RepID=UPI00352385F2